MIAPGTVGVRTVRSRLPTNAAAYLSKRYRRLQCKRLPDPDASSFSGFPQVGHCSRKCGPRQPGSLPCNANKCSQVSLACLTQIRQARITLYSIDPLATHGASTFATSRIRLILKGVRNAKDVEPGNLGLQVFAVHSGGLALTTGNDLA